MTLQELAKLVADMRHAQKEYFRTRSSAALEQSKRLEKEVDKALGRIERGETKSLFRE